MAIILNIDTAVETASVCLVNDRKMLGLAVNEKQKDHAAWLHGAIQDLITNAGLRITDLNAIGLSIGPGSYTGLRIGLSAAKGLCYALNIPLVPVGTLEMMAHSVKDKITDLVCPLIDARRMEVFTAVYNKILAPVIEPCSMLIDVNSFNELLSSHKILFIGNGIHKLQTAISHINAEFNTHIPTSADFADISDKRFHEKKFADLAYIEPLYIKEFYSPVR